MGPRRRSRGPAPFRRPRATPADGTGSRLRRRVRAGVSCRGGWDAIAIDFAPAAVQAGRATAGAWADRIVLADFFAYQPPRPLDLIYERAFLCALPRDLWPQVAARWTQLLAPGALLAGFFFFDDAPKGPPFGIARDRLDELLTPHFSCLVEEAVADSIPVFAGKERWMVWRRV